MSAQPPAQPMTRKTLPDKRSPESNTFQIEVKTEGEGPRALAVEFLAPEYKAAITAIHWGAKDGFANVSLMEVVRELRRQARAASDNHLARPEAMLINQAHSLDAIASKLFEAARANMYEHLEAFERFMRLGLKAQSQCRATLETLAEIKNPKPVAFVGQANIAHGPQQVNNAPMGDACRQSSRAEELNPEPSKLLEQTHGERLDFGTTRQAVGSDPAVATLGPIDRTTHG